MSCYKALLIENMELREQIIALSQRILDVQGQVADEEYVRAEEIVRLLESIPDSSPWIIDPQ
jgi:hypothetical protein